jgi:hypothetical protein
MTRDFATDPEIAADLLRQAASLRDATRTKGADVYDWHPPAILESWPCRGCSTPVGMTAEAIDAARVCNRKLAARGDKLLSKRELAVCDRCRADERIAERERDQARHQAIAALTRELRHGVLPWREEAIADELRGLGADAGQILREAAQANETKSKATSARSKSL